MKVLAFFWVSLATAAARYPVVRTRGLPEIRYTVTSGNSTDPALMPCFKAAHNFISSNKSEEQQYNHTSAVIPSPSGGTIWTVEDLMDAAKNLISNLRSDNNSPIPEYPQSVLTAEQLRNALEILYPVTASLYETERSADFINMYILQTLFNISTKAEEEHGVVQGTFKVEVPTVDISAWSSTEVENILKSLSTTHALIPYLERARRDPMQSLDNGKKYCVITPVGIIPQGEPYYYVPKATKQLIRKIKRQRQDWIKT